jgi:hypothetical protein
VAPSPENAAWSTAPGPADSLPRVDPAEPVLTYAEPPDLVSVAGARGELPDEPPLPDEARAAFAEIRRQGDFAVGALPTNRELVRYAASHRFGP